MLSVKLIFIWTRQCIFFLSPFDLFLTLAQVTYLSYTVSHYLQHVLANSDYIFNLFIIFLLHYLLLLLPPPLLFLLLVFMKYAMKIAVASKSYFQITLSSSYCLFHSCTYTCYHHSLVTNPYIYVSYRLYRSNHTFVHTFLMTGALAINQFIIFNLHEKIILPIVSFA